MSKTEKTNLFELSKEEIVKLFKKSGARSYEENTLVEHIEEGFTPNEDGSVNLFDYVTWLIGDKLDNPPDRMPPTEGFDVLSVGYVELAGWLTLYNHIGYEVTVGRMKQLYQSFIFKFRSKKNERNVDFIKFSAFVSLHRPKQNRSANKASYEDHKEEMNRRNKEASAASRDIGELPAVADSERKEACRLDFRLFCETYFQNTFPLAWSEDHLRCIEKIERSVLKGGLFALALPRGSGKTTLCEIAAVWSMVYGHRLFITLIGATETAALEMLDSIKIEFETNEVLAEDFPEVCFPIACLDGIANRCNGQTYHGERTRITWTSDELVLPTIKGSMASGIIVRVAGITGRVRGMKYKRPDGKAVRPELVIIDDPQTRESARSLEQNKNRTKILSGDILGLAGPGKKIAGVMPCTIIEPGDMADTILDREKHPEWNGEKTKLLYHFPDNMELWDKYSEIRAESLREDGNIQKATEFYREHREEMDKGAVIEWEARYEPDEISAIQNAMNLMYRDSNAFASEYQNEPLRDDTGEEAIMSADEIASKLNGIRRFMVPLDSTKLVMFIDVQKKCLFFTIIAFSDEFNGYVIDYGTYPEQRTRRFSLNALKTTLQLKNSHASLEAQLYKGLVELISTKLQTVYRREDGADISIDRIGVDANWGTSTDIVYQVSRQQEFSGKVYPCHGHYIGASSKPMTDYKKKPGEKVGLNWIIPSVTGKRASRHIVFDSNFWKSFTHSRLAVPIGECGSLSLYGSKPLEHELYSEHMTAEYRVKTQGRGRVVDEWKIRPDRYDNHWLDCTSGCCVLASTLGSMLPEQLHEMKTRNRIELSTLSKPMPTFPVENLSEADASQNQRKSIKLSELMKKKIK